MMTMDEIANNAKITLMWRAGLGFFSVLGTILVGVVLSSINGLRTTVDDTKSDVAQIKWELPVMKKTQEKDKEEILKQIQNLESRIQTIRNLGDEDRKELANLKLEHALLKQKLHTP